MKLIPSFSVDHTRIIPGIYESRIDTLGDEIVTTFDIRMKTPNAEPAIAPAAMHTIEHIIATYLRNDPEWKDKLIYWGPMGCLTGCYIIVKGRPAAADMLNDAFLGLAAVALGLIIWLVTVLIKDPKGKVRAALLKR